MAAALGSGGYDWKAVYPNRKVETDPRTWAETLAEIEARHGELTAALARLREFVG